MEAEGPVHPWPQDMERRRLVALQKFQRNNPNYKQFVYAQFPGTSRDPIQGEKCGPRSVNPVSSASGTKGRLKFRNENRWCLATTMELLEKMKAYVRENKLHCLGEDEKKWQAIAVHLTNPCGLQPTRLARSCMVRFDNLRRYFRKGEVARIEAEVQDSLVEYLQICEQFQPPSLRKTLPNSTVNLARNHGSASPRRQPTPATEEFQHRKDHTETLTKKSTIPPATESDSVDEGDAGKGCGAVRPMTRNRFKRSRLHKASTPCT